MGAHRTREQWLTLVVAFERSGQSAAAFCASRGLTLSTFRWRYSQLRRGAASAAKPDGMRLLAVEVAGARPTGAPVVIAFSGIEVRAEVGADVGYVAALVAGLRSRC
jgi:hypothetical protein